MNRKEIIELAQAAANNERGARARFIKLAKAAGWTGRPSGWIYAPTAREVTPPVCQGWARLATIMADGLVTRWIDALIAAAEPTPAPAADTEPSLSAALRRTAEAITRPDRELAAWAPGVLADLLRRAANEIDKHR